MIDTIKLKIPVEYNEILKNRFEKFSSEIIKFGNDGVIEWESTKVEYLPSSYSKIRITSYNNYFVEFSLQKQQSKVLYNHRNTTIGVDIVFFVSWWEKFCKFLDVKIQIKDLQIVRIDLARNFMITDDVNYLDFFRDLEIAFSIRSEKRCNHYDTAIYYPSRWITKKLYHKHSELLSLHRRGKINKHLVYEDLIIDDLHQFDKIVRFEMEYKSQALKNKNIFYISDIRKLAVNFEEEQQKVIGSINKVSCIDVAVLPPTLKVLYDLVKDYGYSLGRKKYIHQMTERTFQRNHKKLKKVYGINLRSIITDVRQKKEVKNTPSYTLIEAVI